MRITFNGLVLLGMSFILFVAACNTQSGWQYMISACLLALLIISAFLSLLGIQKISVSKYVPGSMYAGKDATVEVTITNDSAREKPFFYIQECPLNTEDNPYAGVVSYNPIVLLIKYLHSNFIHKEYSVSYFLQLLPAKGYVQFEHTFQPKKRGLFCTGKLVLTSSFPFGLFSASRTYSQKREVVVYPEAIDIRGGWINRIANRTVVSQLSYSYIPTSIPGTTRGLREYVPGDSPRHIHWPSSAKTGSLLVREFEIESSGFVYIILDSCPEYESEEYFELAVTTATSLLKACHTEGLTTMFATQPDSYCYEGEFNPEEWTSQMEVLARVAPVSEHPSYKLVDKINQDLLSEERGGSPVFVLISPEEKTEYSANKSNIVSIVISSGYEPLANYCINTQRDLKYI